MFKASLGFMLLVVSIAQWTSHQTTPVFDYEASMLVKPRTPTPFRPLQTDTQQLINEERAKQASAKRIISMSGVGNERYGKKHTKSPT